MLVTNLFSFSHNVFLPIKEIIIWVTFILSSSNAFNLVTSKILSFGKELNIYSISCWSNYHGAFLFKHREKTWYLRRWRIMRDLRIFIMRSKANTRGPWWPWSRSPEPCRLCDIAFKSRDLNHNLLVTSIDSFMIWPSDLVFNLTWPIFKLIWDLMKTDILIKFREYHVENEASRE